MSPGVARLVGRETEAKGEEICSIRDSQEGRDQSSYV